jgi:hypothetical protein
MSKRFTNRALWPILSAVVLAGALGSAGTVESQVTYSGSAPVYPTDHRHLTGSLQICDQGSFFVGGIPKLTQYANSVTPTTGYQELIITQMYVQFQVPQVSRRVPLVMVHGGGYSGSCLESTPDGHEGWFSHAVRHKLATYVVDQAGRGRSGWDRSFVNERIATLNFAGFPNLANTSSSGIWTSWFGVIVPAGADIITGTMIRHGEPGDPACVSNPNNCVLPAQMIPPVPNTVDPSIASRVGAIGPAPNPANDVYLALQHYKYGVPNTDVTLPSSTCSTCVPTTVNGADTWSGRDLATLVEGLHGAMVSTHSQSGSVGHQMVRYLKEDDAVGKCGAPGACLAMLKGLITIDGICSFAASGTAAADYVHIPYLVVRGWYAPSLSDGDCDATVAGIKAAGGTAEFIKLNDPRYGTKFQGVTHMMMMSTKSLEVFDEILTWTDQHIDNPIVEGGCGDDEHPGNE